MPFGTAGTGFGPAGEDADPSPATVSITPPVPMTRTRPESAKYRSPFAANVRSDGSDSSASIAFPPLPE
ncbi:hypothetical protein [Trebonia sp.]|uniref:hypothetical protein n=1 Tax=Trebonia sp. TaxID=2767075 RepID=UPI00261B5245|nr:hypothetical protein [Trebonia sp.]